MAHKEGVKARVQGRIRKFLSGLLTFTRVEVSVLNSAASASVRDARDPVELPVSPVISVVAVVS
jgi:hypothetical protein